MFMLAMQVNAQTIEFGFGLNKTHLWQQDRWLDGFSRKDGLGISIMARYQNPAAFFLLRNNEAGLEYGRGKISILAHTSPGGAGGDYTKIRYQTVSLTLNNYFVNFKTITKGFQLSLGLHYNYKLFTRSEGYFTVPKIGWDPARNYYKFWDEYYYLDGRNNRFIKRFNMGPCIGIAFRPFHFAGMTLRSRYDICSSLGNELKNGMNFDYLRQRFTLSILWGDFNSLNIQDKLKLALQKKAQKAQNRADKKEQQWLKLSSKKSILDKNLEFGVGVNFYHIRVKYNNSGGGSLPGFGFGVRVWQWGNKKYLPAVALSLLQSNTNLDVWTFGMTLLDITAKVKRNSFFMDVYPIKFLFFKNRLDVRLGAEYGLLISNKLSGVYRAQDLANNTYDHKSINSDEFHLMRHHSLGPIATMASPLFRTKNYCIKWRYTFATSFWDFRTNNLPGAGIRHQLELGFYMPLTKK